MTQKPAYRRREFIGVGLGGAVAVSLGAAFWSDLFGDGDGKPRGPGYGPLRGPDQNGVRLPEEFSSQLIARGGEPVSGTDYEWHEASDGAAVFPVDDGGHILVSNSETLEGGASAIHFGRNGQPVDAYRILDGTRLNCSGGGTPWGTWLSCEEVEEGRVWECDPAGRRKAVPRPALGVFTHEAAAVDPRGKRVYLTEDLGDGGFYRFTPRRWRDLSAGRLEIASVRRGGRVDWTPVPDPAARREPTRRQVRGSARFRRGEGIWFDGGIVYITTTGDQRVYAYDVGRERIEVLYDGLASARAPLLRPDQLTASPAGELFVCEDVGTEEIDIAVIDRDRRVARFLSVTGPQHAGSELTGACFDPSGKRLYFASQRARKGTAGGDGPDSGAIYVVTGPFRGAPG
jgi:secreted PhoX family phosphatase